MYFVSIAVLVLVGGTGVLLLAIGGVARLFGGAKPGWWRRALLWTLVTVPVHAIVVFPAALGFLGSRLVETRRDERAYDGPRLARDGSWVLQSRESLRAETSGAARPDPELVSVPAVRFESEDGVALRAFVVDPREGVPRATVVLVHGLFRGALELETVGAMFRDLGCEVVLLELRNHGHSGRAPATFGLHEARDVVAAVRWARARSAEAAARPVALFGVSLGTAAVGLAAPRIEDLGGVVVDAPLTDALATAHRMLAEGPRRRRSFAIPQPFRSLTLTALELWSGFDLNDGRPGDALVQVAPTVPILLIGGTEDRRMLPEDVRTLYERLPQPPGTKEIWLCDGAEHGDVWNVDPAGYRARLGAFVDRIAPR